jgi:hypothetical protein
MDKLLLVSIVVAAALLPARAALDPLPRRGLLRAFLALAAFNALYVFGVVYVLPRLMS